MAKQTEEARARALLKSIEWSGGFGYEDEFPACPKCRGVLPDKSPLLKKLYPHAHIGHTPECELDRFLKGLPKAAKPKVKAKDRR